MNTYKRAISTATISMLVLAACGPTGPLFPTGGAGGTSAASGGAGGRGAGEPTGTSSSSGRGGEGGAGCYSCAETIEAGHGPTCPGAAASALDGLRACVCSMDVGCYAACGRELCEGDVPSAISKSCGECIGSVCYDEGIYCKTGTPCYECFEALDGLYGGEVCGRQKKWYDAVVECASDSCESVCADLIHGDGSNVDCGKCLIEHCSSQFDDCFNSF